ncbi:MAG: hypothetical protein C0518_12975 [Opitutus sp.]|nr:hypothetical protein [Opitutus sp.]
MTKKRGARQTEQSDTALWRTLPRSSQTRRRLSPPVCRGRCRNPSTRRAYPSLPLVNPAVDHPPMNLTASSTSLRFGASLRALTWGLPLALALAAFVAPSTASAAFASTKLSPATQTVNVGESCSVNIVFAVPAGGYVANGIQAWLKFDQTKLQVVSVTTAPSSPFTNVFANSFDNTAGTLTFGATGGSVVNSTFAVAKVTFNPIAAGNAALTFQNVNEYIGATGYGVNGLATGGSITVNQVSVFASGYSPVIAWDPIYPAQAYPNWLTESKPIPSVGYDANWVNPHPASVFPKGTHPWEFTPPMDFDAHWINAWSDISSRGPSGQNWTKYSTMVTGEGQFVLQFLADNASWIYINGNLVGFQHYDWMNTATGRYTITLTGAGPHELSFIILDGGGAAGGKFRLETTASFLANNPGEDLPPPPTPSDTTAPVITGPGNLTAEATSAAGAAVNFSASAIDDVDGPVTVVADPASGSTFPLGTSTVDLGASDAAGNIASASFQVTVRDTTAPALSVPAGVTAEATSAAGANVSYASATATDAVGVTAVTYSAASGSTFALGTTNVSVNASDAAGNSSSGSFSVTVQDTTAPALSVPANITAEATSAAGASVSYAPATATDAVGVASITYSAASGSTFALGTTTVSVQAADAAGNASAGSFAVTVQDTTAPTISSVTPSTREIWPPNKKMVPVTVSVGATDAVGIASAKIVSVTTNQPDNRTQWQITGPLGVSLLADRLGSERAGRIYTIMIEVRDAAGNVSTQSTAVTVPHDQRR